MRLDKKIIVGESVLDLRTPVVMSILNVTPDSFWSESRCSSEEEIIRCVELAAQGGAEIIDVGGYSSRPGASDLSPEEEFERVAKGLCVIRKRYPNMAVSIDTFRAWVARKAIEEFGACIINDISGGDLDLKMIETVADLRVPYIVMHMRGEPATMQKHVDYHDLVDDMKAVFRQKIAELRDAGVRDIIVDPGFGFAKTTQQNYQLLHRLEEFSEFGYPMLVGVSRKSMIYKVLETEPGESLAGTIALNWEALRKGANILRVHDPKEAADLIKLNEYYKKAYEF